MKDANPGEILQLSLASEYDFRVIANPADPLRARFLDWVPYYKTKWAIARALQPGSILEIGVRYGYSAAAFLDGCPSARYLGIDLDSEEFGGVKGAINWAREITEQHATEFLVADTQKMTAFPGGTYDLIHVDGQQDGDGTFHDLELAIHQGRFVLVDGFFWTAQNFHANSEFLFRNRDLIEYFLVIPGYAGELLIKSRGEAVSSGTASAVKCSEDIRHAYTSDYYLEDCGGFSEYQRSNGRKLEDGRLVGVAAVAGLVPSGRVLDLGCGRGELAYYFAQRGYQVTAVDYSDDAIRLAERTFADDPDLRSRVELCCANLSDYELSGSYDIVVAADVVEHLTAPELDALYQKVSQHLAPGGMLVIHTYPNLWYFQYDYARRRRLAAALGAYLPREPRTRYELLMHVNEQNPRVLKRQLGKYFGNVLLWFGEPSNNGGSLLRRYSHREMAAAQDLWAIASQHPVNAESLRSRLESKALPGPQLSVIRMTAKTASEKVRAGQEFGVSVEIANRSVFALGSMPPAPVHISYHWMRPDGGSAEVFNGERSPIHPPLPPGSTCCFEARVVSPPAPGAYLLRMTLVQEGVQWFDAPPIQVKTDILLDVVP